MNTRYRKKLRQFLKEPGSKFYDGDLYQALDKIAVAEEALSDAESYLDRQQWKYEANKLAKSIRPLRRKLHAAWERRLASMNRCAGEPLFDETELKTIREHVGEE